MQDLEINMVSTGFANTIITPVTAPNWHCGDEQMKKGMTFYFMPSWGDGISVRGGIYATGLGWIGG
jgi:hypothetical protein